MEKQHEVAQGAQAGDDIAHMQLVMRGADDDLDCAKRLHAAGYRRAALATQPAEWADQLYTQGFDAGAAASKRLNAVRGAEHE